MRTLPLLCAAVAILSSAAAGQLGVNLSELTASSESLPRPTPFPSPYEGQVDLLLEDDQMRGVLDGIPVTLSQGTSSLYAGTDAEGKSPALTCDMTKPVRIEIDEVMWTSGDWSVGQAFRVNPNLLSEGVGALTVDRFTPVARGYTIKDVSSASDEPGGLWSIPVDQLGASYNFAAWISFMRAPTVVRAYSEYHALGLPPDVGPAFLIRTVNQVDLGPTGFLLDLDVGGCDVAPASGLLPLHVGPGSAGMQLEWVSSDPQVAAGHVALRVFGSLAAGDNVIVFTQGPSMSGLAFTTPHPLGTAALMSTDSTSAWESATCTPPEAGGCNAVACVPPVYSTGAPCAGMPPEAVGPPSTTMKLIKVGDKLCAPEGTSVNQRRCITVSGGVSVQVGVDPLKVTANGSISGMNCIDIKVEAGYCAQAWACRSKTTQSWEVCSCLLYVFAPICGSRTTSCIVDTLLQPTSCKIPQ